MYLWNFFKTELSSGRVVDYQESEYIQKRENVYVFLRLPWALEKVSNPIDPNLVYAASFNLINS